VRIRGYAEGTPCWAELCTPDPDAAAAFYQELFGWQLDDGVFRLGGHAVAGLRAGPPPAPAWLTYLATEDLAELGERVTGGGGTVVVAPAEVGDRGRGALFRDSCGAVFGGWQRGTLAGAQIAAEPDTVCWSDLAGEERVAAAFYGTIFGWTVQPGVLTPEREYRDLAVHGRVVAGLIPLPPERAAEAAWWTTIEVSDRAATVQRCLDLGGRVALGSVNVSVGGYARLADPLGAPFGVIELIPHLRGWSG
jgi:predicted enzyme related to lactoylglutathione lyase